MRTRFPDTCCFYAAKSREDCSVGSAVKAMSDFPSSECPRIPWRDAVHRVPLGSTAAPGPPNQTVLAGQKTNSQKKRRRMAASLGGNSAPADNHTTHKCVNLVKKGPDSIQSYIFCFVPCSGNDAGDWDPMANDYNSTDFNAYNSGVGALMQAGRSLGGEGGGDITLFVSNIPTTLTKVSMTCPIHFSGFAAVTNCCLLLSGWIPWSLLSSWHSQESTHHQAHPSRQANHLWVSLHV